LELLILSKMPIPTFWNRSMFLKTDTPMLTKRTKKFLLSHPTREATACSE
jgi:hypothetical protein